MLYMFLLRILSAKVTIGRRTYFLPFMIIVSLKFRNSVFALLFGNMKVLQYGWKVTLIYIYIYIYQQFHVCWFDQSFQQCVRVKSWVQAE